MRRKEIEIKTIPPVSDAVRWAIYFEIPLVGTKDTLNSKHLLFLLRFWIFVSRDNDIVAWQTHNAPVASVSLTLQHRLKTETFDFSLVQWKWIFRGRWIMAPTQIRMPGRNDLESGGVNICCCRVFTCVNPGILTSNHGLLKVSEVLLGLCCQTMLVRFGMPNAEDIGQAFNSCLTTVSACLLTSALLLLCYVISIRTFHLVRQSLFVSFSPNEIWYFCVWCRFSLEFICLAGDFIQFVRLFYVFEFLCLHGIQCFVLVVPEIRIATRICRLSCHDCRLCESSWLDHLFPMKWIRNFHFVFICSTWDFYLELFTE